VEDPDMRKTTAIITTKEQLLKQNHTAKMENRNVSPSSTIKTKSNTIHPNKTES
jgi:hypothetical protein